MVIRSLLRASAAAKSANQWRMSQGLSFFSTKSKAPTTKSKPRGPKPKFDKNQPKDETPAIPAGILSSREEAELRRRLLAEDQKNPALDVGPNGRPLFTTAPSLSSLTEIDINTYFNFSMAELKQVLPEGFPAGMEKEFEESQRSALLVRQSFIELRDNFRRVVDPSLVTNFEDRKVRKQVVLDGLRSCGKSITLAMLVQWARKEGWLVFYVPRGQDWTHHGMVYKNPNTGLFDNPAHATNILKDFLKYNSPLLEGLKCTMHDPVPLGNGAGVGLPKGSDKMEISEDTSLCQLIEAGINNTHASVGVVVRLREELSKVTSVPVLFAIDQYNSWFTFTDFEEQVTFLSSRPIHAKELATVNAFRSMMHDQMMVGAFSQSTAVGKLRLELPDVPVNARATLPRYNLEEGATVCHYYLRQRMIQREAFTDENWKKIFFLSNGNGTEIRHLAPFIR